MRSLILYHSLTGNTKTFADFLFQESKTHNPKICNDFSESISDYDRIAIGAFSWGGQGKMPRKMKQFLISNKDNFKNKEVLIFGSGNSIYPHFCKAVDGMERIVSDCGAEVIGAIKFEQRFSYESLTADELINLEESLKKWNG